MSSKSKKRVTQTVEKEIKMEKEQLNKKLIKLKNKSYACIKDAENALADISKKLKYHIVKKEKIKSKKMYKLKGRPKLNQKESEIHYQISGKEELKESIKESEINRRSCYIIGSNIDTSALKGKEIIEKYKNQNNSIERGFRFLKDPLFFVSSLFLKKESRIMSLLFIMVLSLLIYSILQMYLRKQLSKSSETIPNQIRKPTKNPTLRWVFHIMEGIDVIYYKIQNSVQKMITGLDDTKKKIISFMYNSIKSIYEIKNQKNSFFT